MVLSAMPTRRGLQCIWLLEAQVDPVAVLCFPEAGLKGIETKDAHVQEPRPVYLVEIYADDISFTRGTVH